MPGCSGESGPDAYWLSARITVTGSACGRMAFVWPGGVAAAWVCRESVGRVGRVGRGRRRGIGGPDVSRIAAASAGCGAGAVGLADRADYWIPVQRRFRRVGTVGSVHSVGFPFRCVTERWSGICRRRSVRFQLIDWGWRAVWPVGRHCCPGRTRRVTGFGSHIFRRRRGGRL